MCRITYPYAIVLEYLNRALDKPYIILPGPQAESSRSPAEAGRWGDQIGRASDVRKDGYADVYFFTGAAYIYFVPSVLSSTLLTSSSSAGLSGLPTSLLSSALFLKVSPCTK